MMSCWDCTGNEFGYSRDVRRLLRTHWLRDVVRGTCRPRFKKRAVAFFCKGVGTGCGRAR